MTIKYYCCIIIYLFFAILFASTEGDGVAVGEKQYKPHFPAELNDEKLNIPIKPNDEVQSLESSKVWASASGEEKREALPDGPETEKEAFKERHFFLIFKRRLEGRQSLLSS